MTTKKRIAIIGAGVAGMAFAILAVRQGHFAHVFERRPQVGSELGAGVTLWPNASFVLKQMGLLDDIVKVSGKPKSMVRFDQYSSEQPNEPFREKSRLVIHEINRQAQHETYSILRRDLMEILFDALQKTLARIHFSHPIQAEELTQLKIEYDLVIGADGRMHSAARQNITAALNTELPVDNEAIYQGFINVIGITQSPLTLIDKGVIQDYWGDGERFGIVPINDKTCYWAAGWASSPKRKSDQPFTQEDLIQRFQHWPKPVTDVLQQSQSGSINTIYVHDINPITSWHNGNVLLIGDAAHAALPTSGQGACQALEDAWTLAQLLLKHDDIDVVLQLFQAKRIDKTTAIQRTGRHIAQTIFHTKPSERAVDGSISQTPSHTIANFWMSGLTPS
ncbi:MAG: 2-polyprenyl-6-methoxyphenol hydroxylase-like FAD-dependent oxidoreductase [Marinomonas primoryensis]|jgi:2-polyprenyl-6-methoxyphenol hydroxylase-like FAD-dependent oxidoreductase